MTDALNFRHSIPQGFTWSQIKADSGGRKLLLMRDGQRRGDALDESKRFQRRLHASGPRYIELLQSCRISLLLWRSFKNDAILIGLRINGGDLALTKGAVECIGNILD